MKLLQGLAGSPAVYLSLAVLHSLYCCSKADGVINIAPMTQYANLSSDDHATFYCRATGSNTFWAVNDDIFPTRNNTMNGLVFVEMTRTIPDQDNVIHDIYLSIPTTVDYNETEVRCISYVNHQILSDIAYLYIQGGPGAPDVVLRMVNPGLMVLQWKAPFTWNHTSIEHYKITSNNSAWDHNLYTGTSLELVLAEGSEEDECAVYSFTVLANNGVADGESKMVTGGFPIVPVQYEDTITPSYSFTSDHQVIVHLEVKFPRVCGYQQVRYTVTVTNLNSEMVYQDGPREELYGQMATVEVSTGALPNNQQYVAEVMLDVLGFEEDSPEYHISTTTRPINPVMVGPSPDPPMPRTPGTTEIVVGGTSSESEKIPTTPLIAAFVAAGVIIVIVLVMVSTIIYFYRKKRSAIYRAAAPPTGKPMVTNPIYDGQTLYETIADPSQLTSSIPPPTPTSARPLLFSSVSMSSDSPSTPGSTHPLLTHAPYGGPAPMSIDPAYSYPPPHPLPFPPPSPGIDDGYTTMASAASMQSKLNPESGQDESSLDKEMTTSDEDEVRYVLDDPKGKGMKSEENV